MANSGGRHHQEDSSSLVLLLELSSPAWAERANAKPNPAEPGTSPLDLHQFLTQILVFVNSFLMTHQGNHLAVLALMTNDCHFVYTSPVAGGSSVSADEKGAGMPAYLAAGTHIIDRLKELLRAEESAAPVAQLGPGGSTAPPFAAALSRALCYLNRLGKGGEGGVGGASAPPSQQKRVLSVLVSPDHPPQYIAVMNAVFSAQRSGVVLDSCLVGLRDSAFMQQAAHISGGIYLKPQQQQALLQYLMSVFGVQQDLRGKLELPRPLGVDFRASCFCHKNTIDLGHVCSVCLSVFCEVCKECSTCGTEFTRRRSVKNKA